MKDWNKRTHWRIESDVGWPREGWWVHFIATLAISVIARKPHPLERSQTRVGCNSNQIFVESFFWSQITRSLLRGKKDDLFRDLPVTRHRASQRKSRNPANLNSPHRIGNPQTQLKLRSYFSLRGKAFVSIYTKRTDFQGSSKIFLNRAADHNQH